MTHKHHGDRVVFRDAEALETVSPDADIENADWTKQTWDLPPYKSPEFMEMYPDLEKFKQSSAYARAVDQGLIIDDEWAADFIEPVTKE